MEQPDWLHPYTAIAGKPSQGDFAFGAVRDLLRDRAQGQASSVVAAIDRWEPGKLPGFLAAVGRETAGDAPKRVANMLRAFRRYLGALSDQEGEAFVILDPMLARVGENWYLTSPALLVIQAILYSHEQWFRPEHHEAHSALSAYDRLHRLDPQLSERDRCFVAALIAHQTLLRVAWQVDDDTPREVSAFDGQVLTANYAGAGTQQDEKRIARGLARTLFPFIDRFETDDPNGAGRLRPWLAAALALCSFCLEHRHHPEEETWSPLLQKQAHRFAGLLAASEPEKGPRACTLVFWQYGRLVMRLQQRYLWERFRERIVQKMERRTASELHNLTYCFDRNASRKPWEPWPPETGEPCLFQLDEIGAAGEAGKERRRLIQNIEATVGLSFTISPGPKHLVLRALGLEAVQDCHGPIERWLDGGDPFLETFGALIKAFEQTHLSYSQKFKDDLPKWYDAFQHGYFPVPLVGHVLRELQRVRPEDFSLLKLRPRDLPAEVKAPFVSRPLIIHLPRTHESLEHSAESRRAKWLIARYVAAMVMNLLVTLAPRRVELDFFSEEVRHSWKEWVDQALRENACGAFLEYLMQYRSESCRTQVTEALEGVPETARVFQPGVLHPRRPLYILGVDIGGTAIKCGRVRIVQRKTGLLDLDTKRSSGEILEIPTDASSRYRNAASFARRIFNLIKEKQPAWLRSGFVAIGIAWPGAVRDSMVAASSGILAKFEGFNGKTSDDVQAIHQLGICEAFRGQYLQAAGGQPEGTSSPVVVLLNDGDADIKATEHLLVGGGDHPQGVSIILKAGTGTACGIYVDGRQVELLAEVGKLVINLGGLDGLPSTLPAEPVQEKGFPEGLLNRHFSKKTLPAIAEALGWRVPGNTPAMDSREIGYFISGRPAAMEPRIAQELIFQRLKDLVASPEDVKGDAAPVQLYYPWGDRLKAVAAERVRQLEAGVPEGWPSTESLARECARIAGRQLADAIALLVDLFRCREVRLGGGPLTGKTGEVIAAHAAESLKEVYAFEVERVHKPAEPGSRVGPGGSRATVGVDPHPLSEDRWIRMHFPRSAKADSLPTGPLGAARAALDVFVRETKRKALAAERSRIETLPLGSIFGRDEPAERSLTQEDVSRLIETFTTSLSLRTRGDGTYEKI